MTSSTDEAFEPVRFTTRGDFVPILDRLGLSLAAVTQPRQLVFLGAIDGALTTTAALFGGPMGLAVDGDRMAVATSHSIFVFNNINQSAARHPDRPNYYDAFFIPKTIHLTGECRWHDITFARDVIIGTNTRFSAICRIDDGFHFTPLWRPSFVSALMPEDRCHLNGFTGENFELSYVTALGASDEPWGWRESIDTAGILIDARRNVILRSDLCMPHSPRLVGDELYVLNGGEGEVLRIDRNTGASATIASLPGFTHGLCHYGGILFVGMSLNRLSRLQSPAPVSRRFPNLVAGIAAIDQRSGEILGSVEFDGVTEVYDIQALPGIRRAGIQSLLSDDPYEGVGTPAGVFWSSRAEQGARNMAEAAATGHYQINLDMKL